MEVRMCLVGAGGIGAKSALVVRFLQGNFIERYDPTIEDSYRTYYEKNGEAYFLDIMDTCGQEEYSHLRLQYIRLSEAFLVGYSVTTTTSFEAADKLITHICKAKGCKRSEIAEKIPLILVGNKIDLEECRQVSYEQGQALANKLNIPFIETSAKTNTNVEECFSILVQEWRKKCGALLQLEWSPFWKELTTADHRALRRLKKILKRQNSAAIRQALLWVAVSHNFHYCVSYLVKEMDPGEINYLVKGTTVLHEAARNGNKTLVRKLLSHGADVTVTDRHGQTASVAAKTPQIRYLLQTYVEITLSDLLEKTQNPNTLQPMKSHFEKKISMLTSNQSSRQLLDQLRSWKALPWSPETHYRLPHKLQLQIKELFMIYRLRPQSRLRILPPEIIFHIFSFVVRDFENPKNTKKSEEERVHCCLQ